MEAKNAELTALTKACRRCKALPSWTGMRIADEDSVDREELEEINLGLPRVYFGRYDCHLICSPCTRKCLFHFHHFRWSGRLHYRFRLQQNFLRKSSSFSLQRSLNSSKRETRYSPTSSRQIAYLILTYKSPSLSKRRELKNVKSSKPQRSPRGLLSKQASNSTTPNAIDGGSS